MPSRRIAVVACLLIAAAAGNGRTADTQIPGTSALVRPTQIVRGVHRPSSGTFPLPGSAVDATMALFDTATPSAGNVLYTLPEGRWSGLDTPAGSAGWRYLRPSTSAEPCFRVIVKPRVIKYLCQRRLNSVPDLAPPFAGDLGVVLEVGGERYCARFGGETVQNDAERLRRRNAAAPASCPTPGCGVFVTQIGSGGSDPGELLHPRGVAVGAGGEVYVANSDNHRIEKFAADGSFITSWGTFGSDDGEFSTPMGVMFHPSGDVYVIDTNNHRIQRFTSAGVFVAKWGTQGSDDGQFSTPLFAASDANGDVYVSDFGNHRVQKFTAAGTFVTKWGTQGAGDGEFSFPHGIAVDAGLQVYVADAQNARIQKFTSTGAYVSQWGGPGFGPGQLTTPAGVALDGNGDVYVAELGGSRVQKFTSSGIYVARWGNTGNDSGQFREPFGVAVDAAGDVFVAELTNRRVQKFSCP